MRLACLRVQLRSVQYYLNYTRDALLPLAKTALPTAVPGSETLASGEHRMQHVRAGAHLVAAGCAQLMTITEPMHAMLKAQCESLDGLRPHAEVLADTARFFVILLPFTSLARVLLKRAGLLSSGAVLGWLLASVGLTLRLLAALCGRSSTLGFVSELMPVDTMRAVLVLKIAYVAQVLLRLLVLRDCRRRRWLGMTVRCSCSCAYHLFAQLQCRRHASGGIMLMAWCTLVLQYQSDAILPSCTSVGYRQCSAAMRVLVWH